MLACPASSSPHFSHPTRTTELPNQTNKMEISSTLVMHLVREYLTRELDSSARWAKQEQKNNEISDEPSDFLSGSHNKMSAVHDELNKLLDLLTPKEAE